MLNIAVIGAGISGLCCAHFLKKAGFQLSVFEKSRGLGGRMATRRTDFGSFDHGAQYIRVRDRDFADYILKAIDQKAIVSWTVKGAGRDVPSLIGTPTMRSFVNPLAENLNVFITTKITRIERDGEKYQLFDEEKRFGVFDLVISSAPAPQTYALFNVLEPSFSCLNDISYAPCLTLMVGFAEKIPLSDVCRPHESPIAFIARNTSKGGRESDNDLFVIQYSGNASLPYIEWEKEDLIAPMMDAFKGVLKTHDPRFEMPIPFYAQAHRWLYAKVEKSLNQDFVSCPKGKLHFCGDGCLGARVESAYLSGFRLAQNIIKRSML